MFSYHKQTAQFVAAVVQNIPEIPGETMQSWIENPMALQNVLKTALCSPIPIWKKTIKLGTGLRTTADFRKSLKDNGFRVGDWASDILKKSVFTVAAERTEVDLVKLTVGDLGFKRGARFDQICERAKELGLELCPPEVGPQLRLQYKDQPIGERILVAMEPITDSDGRLHVFSVECNISELWLGNFCSELWLGSFCGESYVFWRSGDCWVFVRPRR